MEGDFYLERKSLLQMMFFILTTIHHLFYSKFIFLKTNHIQR